MGLAFGLALRDQAWSRQTFPWPLPRVSYCGDPLLNFPH